MRGFKIGQKKPPLTSHKDKLFPQFKGPYDIVERIWKMIQIGSQQKNVLMKMLKLYNEIEDENAIASGILCIGVTSGWRGNR